MKWTMVNNKVHVDFARNELHIFRINTDSSLSGTAWIINGIRSDFMKKDQPIWKKVK